MTELLLRFENILHRLAEYFRDLEGERQAWVVLPGFYGVRRLLGDAQPVRELHLGPPARLAQLGQVLLVIVGAETSSRE